MRTSQEWIIIFLSPFSETGIELEKEKKVTRPPKKTHTHNNNNNKQILQVFILISSTSSRLQVRQNMFSEG